jgi:ParB family chromosome partitioning protein
VDVCKQAMQDNPALEIVQSLYGSNANGDVYAELSEQGYMINESSIKTFPKAPEMPERDRFEELEEYGEAIEEYDMEFACYVQKNEEIENLLAAGKAKAMLTVNNNEVVKGYAVLPENEAQQTVNEPDTVQKLEKQDKRNREIAIENIVDDTKKYIRETEIPQSDFTEFEDRMLYFVMLDDLKREHFTLFLDNSQNKWHLTDEEKITIISNLTEEQMTLIRRDFLVKHLSNTFGTAKKSFLMLEFARLHFPETLSETENKYNDVYEKRHRRITERLEALKEIRTEIEEVA